MSTLLSPVKSPVGFPKNSVVRLLNAVVDVCLVYGFDETCARELETPADGVSGRVLLPHTLTLTHPHTHILTAACMYTHTHKTLSPSDTHFYMHTPSHHPHTLTTLPPHRT